jgi:nanoRNase/pAp phosphatase (c-di-AMP/oligoRNAs hydrolase)
MDSRLFVHPKDVQDGLIEVNANDVLANIPYAEGCGLWFDHHSSEDERMKMANKFKGDSRPAPSAARVIYDYYGGEKIFGNLQDMMVAVDKSDSGQLTVNEIINPQGWILLSFVMDPRTGLGRFKDYRISNYQLMDDLIELLGKKPIEEILQMPDVAERVKRYYEQNELFKQMILQHTRTDANVIITDLRGVDVIYSGNRFLLYSLYPEQNISVWMIDGRNKQNCVYAVGHSIIKRTSKTDVGSLMLKYGGGGHKVVGTCQVPYEKADTVLNELVSTIKKDG